MLTPFYAIWCHFDSVIAGFLGYYATKPEEIIGCFIPDNTFWSCTEFLTGRFVTVQGRHEGSECQPWNGIAPGSSRSCCSHCSKENCSLFKCWGFFVPLGDALCKTLAARGGMTPEWDVKMRWLKKPPALSGLSYNYFLFAEHRLKSAGITAGFVGDCFCKCVKAKWRSILQVYLKSTILAELLSLVNSVIKWWQNTLCMFFFSIFRIHIYFTANPVVWLENVATFVWLWIVYKLLVEVTVTFPGDITRLLHRVFTGCK